MRREVLVCRRTASGRNPSSLIIQQEHFISNCRQFLFQSLSVSTSYFPPNLKATYPFIFLGENGKLYL